MRHDFARGRFPRIAAAASCLLAFDVAAAPPTSEPAPRAPAWWRRHAPAAQTVEMSVLVGAFLPSEQHELYDRSVGYQPLARGLVELGARIDYYPLRWFAFELEGAAMPGKTRGGDRVALSSFSGGLTLRWPGRIAPLVSGGVGVLTIQSSSAVLGDDLDLAFRYGAGLQWFIDDRWALRLDGRDVVSNRRGIGGLPAHHGEVLLAIAVQFGRPSPARATATAVPREPDTDRDGIADAYDRCPRAVGMLPDGCPRPDHDADGFLDEIDRCPREPGEYPDGCPPGAARDDADGDGIAGAADHCPEAAGSGTDGCPTATTDSDGDGIVDAVDLCPREKERRNGVDDTDGCPDEIPEAMTALEGVLTDVTFASRSTELTAGARERLRRLVATISRHPGVRFELVGHTDDQGDAAANRAISLRRAEVVRDAMVALGVDAGRIQVRGAGEDEPIASNATPQGRATNRRIELAILRE